jgi:hypothetical protein
MRRKTARLRANAASALVSSTAPFRCSAGAARIRGSSTNTAAAAAAAAAVGVADA